MVILSLFAVILRSAAVLSGAKELLFVKQMPRIRSAQAPDLLLLLRAGSAKNLLVMQISKLADSSSPVAP